MRDSIRYDVIRPFLKCTGIDIHLFRIVGLQVIIKKIIQGNNDMQGIFVNHFKRSQSHQCLLMTMIQINGNISVINSSHIRIKHTGSQFREFFLICHPIEEGCITSYSQNFPVQTFDIPSRF